MYLAAAEVKQIFATILHHFPSAYLMFDSMSEFMRTNIRMQDAVKHFDAKFTWSIEDVKEIENWNSNFSITPYPSPIP